MYNDFVRMKVYLLCAIMCVPEDVVPHPAMTAELFA